MQNRHPQSKQDRRSQRELLPKRAVHLHFDKPSILISCQRAEFITSVKLSAARLTTSQSISAESGAISLDTLWLATSLGNNTYVTTCEFASSPRPPLTRTAWRRNSVLSVEWVRSRRVASTSNFRHSRLHFKLWWRPSRAKYSADSFQWAPFRLFFLSLSMVCLPGADNFI